MEGWIKLYRAARNHWVFKDKEAWQIWCYCLLDATHTQTQRRVKGQVVNLHPGQTLFGRLEWSRILNVDSNKVYRTVIAFQDAGMISLYTVKGKYSVITITNWQEYQGERLNSYRTNSEQESEQAESVDNQALKPMSEQQSKQQMNSKRTHNKNVKNAENKDKKILPSKVFDDDSVEMTLALELKGYILCNNSKARVPDENGIQKWATDIDKMIRLDGRTVQEISRVIQFSQKDGFWKSNILSGSKLREKYDTLYLQMVNREGVKNEGRYNGSNAESQKCKFDKSRFLAPGTREV